jgi:hypothetical protein
MLTVYRNRGERSIMGPCRQRGCNVGCGCLPLFPFDQGLTGKCRKMMEICLPESYTSRMTVVYATALLLPA